MRAAVIGANGKVGKRLCKLLSQSGDRPLAFIRKKEQSRDFENLGIETKMADLIQTTANEYTDMMKGCDAVVFSAGAGGAGEDLTTAIDGEGLKKIVEAAKKAGISRFLLVSAFPDAGRDRKTSSSFEHYMKVKRQADVQLAKSSLNWTILRPGTLVDDPGTGRIELGQAIPYGKISRDDVAAVLAELLKNPSAGKLILEVTEGKLPIKEAVTSQCRPF